MKDKLGNEYKSISFDDIINNGKLISEEFMLYPDLEEVKNSNYFMDEKLGYYYYYSDYSEYNISKNEYFYNNQENYTTIEDLIERLNKIVLLSNSYNKLPIIYIIQKYSYQKHEFWIIKISPNIKFIYENSIFNNFKYLKDYEYDINSSIDNYLLRYFIKELQTIGFSEMFSTILFDSFGDSSTSEKIKNIDEFINYCKALKSTDISNDLLIYFIMKILYGF